MGIVAEIRRQLLSSPIIAGSRGSYRYKSETMDLERGLKWSALDTPILMFCITAGSALLNYHSFEVHFTVANFGAEQISGARCVSISIFLLSICLHQDSAIALLHDEIELGLELNVQAVLTHN